MRPIILMSVLTIAAQAGCGGNGGGAGAAERSEVLSFARYDDGALALEYPEGWQLFWAGEGSTLAFVTRDPRSPGSQVFFFGSVGPVYASRQQKQIDQSYARMGGYPPAWIDMPVVDPLTPQHFMAAWPVIARTAVARSFMPQVPDLDRITIVHAERAPNPLAMGERGVVRAVFRSGDGTAEGLFCVTVAPFMPFTGSPGGGNAYGFMVCGITAPRSEFAALHDGLAHVLESFRVSPQYAQSYVAGQQGVWEGVLQVGRTLSETSDRISESWRRRDQSHDITAEKRSDAILGLERLYDPDTGEVYAFENGFYDRYRLDPQQYDLSRLQPLPDDDHTLWTRAPLDGVRELH